MSNQAVQRKTTKGNGVGGWSGEDGKKKEKGRRWRRRRRAADSNRVNVKIEE